MNGHVGRTREGIERAHGGWGVGGRNGEGERVVDCAVSFDLAIVNTWFEKKENQHITYKSGARESQIDFRMCRRSHLREVRNCKVLNGGCVAAQHRVVVMDLEIKNTGKGRPAHVPSTIRWWKLTQEEEAMQEFKGESIEGS
ncbi:craniofacial development protein 2-like [Macrobrachium rosenbergii]|uniref:craniofacial development protein 2-like n=1 Tax=Macrobrachium rosenbergii TaxID=79674 RepID=UPI0034D6D6A0